MNKRLVCLFAVFCLFLSACAPAAQGTERFTVIATLFPQYDFARQIAGDKAEVRLLLPPGVESHAFEPTPSDIVAINEADVFIYTGEYMEPWAARIAESIEGDVLVSDVSEGIEPDPEEHDDAVGETHAVPYDPHIWTDPVRAEAMARNVEKALCEADPENAEYYRANADAYARELEALDNDLSQAVKTSAGKKIWFGGRFAMNYFANRYGLECEAAFDSCSAESEPSAQRVAAMIDGMRAEGAPVIFYEELADPKIARTISEATGAEMLLLHSCHNLSEKEMASGETYITLMRQNLENLKKALG
jgi:zinc transport system substrate-binding protein